MSRPVFLDTSALIALIMSDDALHARAVAVQAELESERANLLTTDWVLSELLAYASGRPRRRAATSAVEALISSPSVTVIAASRRTFSAAFQLYRSRTDKEWSLVDCASILVCRTRRVSRVFTHDHHFSQAGFEVLL